VEAVAAEARPGGEQHLLAAGGEVVLGDAGHAVESKTNIRS
jgi:hypothetical protein